MNSSIKKVDFHGIQKAYICATVMCKLNTDYTSSIIHKHMHPLLILISISLENFPKSSWGQLLTSLESEQKFNWSVRVNF